MPSTSKSSTRPTGQPAVLQLATARELIDAGSVRTVELVGQPGGYAVVLHVGMQQRPLGAKNSAGARVFTRLETAVSTLRELGVVQFVVDASNHGPSLVQRRRPDASRQLTEAHRARAHDKWFRAQVEAALANPNRKTVDAETAHAELRTHAQSLREKAGVAA